MERNGEFARGRQIDRRIDRLGHLPFGELTLKSAGIEAAFDPTRQQYNGDAGPKYPPSSPR